MPVMNEAERQEAHLKHMRHALFVAGDAPKSSWRQLIDAADEFVNDGVEKSHYNQKIPGPVRNDFSPRQKALALWLVIGDRFLLGKDDV